jgi:ketosteroid isomerase-like protein
MTTSLNLELVHAIFADWERGDLSSVDWADPKIDFVFADGPEPGTHVGREAMQELFRGWLNSFANFRLLADRVIEIDSHRVLALTHAGGQGKTSGVNLTVAGSAFGHLFELRGGKVARLVVYFDRDHALAELGLTREIGHPPGS